ncbi:MAG: 7-cyano-7-deazaguanine synthase [Candidatus Bathyarchaeia archaeon]
MSLNLDSLLSEHLAETSPLRQFFWRKERKADGISYPIPLKEQYVDFLRLVLGLHIIEIRHLEYVKELRMETSYPDDFLSIVNDCESLFYLLANMKVNLKIIPSSSRHSWRKIDEGTLYKDIVPFSGGLDSLCGALSSSKHSRIILSHCKTNLVIFGKVLKLSDMNSFKRSVLYCMDATSKTPIAGVSDTRGLLFLSFAYAIAASLDLRYVTFCENGSQMLDVMLGSLVYPNKPATKNTNPVYIDKIESIFSNFYDKTFKIECPFKDMTKAEMLLPLKNEIRFEDTYSCFSPRGRAAMCGECYNCFVRRLSLLAINVAEKNNVYEVNPFTVTHEIHHEGSAPSTNILFHFLRFYSQILMRNSSSMNEIEVSSRGYFRDPLDLATRFAEDVFLGVNGLLGAIGENQLNALGKKARELLDQLDKKTLRERKEELT